METLASNPGRAFLLVPAVVLGCASAPGSKPHDMSAKNHEAEADSHEAEAADHQGSGEAARAVDRSPFPPATRQPGLVAPCWSSTARPGAQHLAHAEEHRRIAADHRAASRALRETEVRACAGIPDADRDMSPFAQVENIASIEPLIDTKGTRRSSASAPPASS